MECEARHSLQVFYRSTCKVPLEVAVVIFSGSSGKKKKCGTVLCYGGLGLKIVRETAHRNLVFPDFPHLPQENFGIVPQIRLLPLLSVTNHITTEPT